MSEELKQRLCKYLRQYKHNDDSPGFVAAYHLDIEKEFISLQSQLNAALEENRVLKEWIANATKVLCDQENENQKLKDMLSKG